MNRPRAIAALILFVILVALLRTPLHVHHAKPAPPTYPRPVVVTIYRPSPVAAPTHNGCPLLAGVPTCARRSK